MNSADFHIWTLTPTDVYQNLRTTDQGISEIEANLRLTESGYNELPEPERIPLILRFTDQLTHFMALLLWVAGILAFVSQTPELGWAIWAVIWINAIFSFWQEFQAEKALAALVKVLPSQARVYRDGKLSVIPSRELVSGDVVQLEEGDRISADARIINSQSLYVDMSVLTGESVPVPRTYEAITTQNIHASEASNLVFAGSTIAAGRGRAVVYATGRHTEFGQVAHLTTNMKREPSTLEVQISKLVNIITIIALGMGVVTFLLTKFLGGVELKESFIFATGIIVAFVPEGLLPTVSLALAISVKRMAAQNVLVRRLSAIETLSATTVICTDKTGTLTKNQITVCQLWIPNTQINVTGVGYEPKGEVEIISPKYKSQVQLMLAGAALCSNAQLNHPPNSNQWLGSGDPTEVALLVAAIKAGLKLEELQRRVLRIREVPFDSHRRMMTVLLEGDLQLENTKDSQCLVFSKGATLDLLQHSRYLWYAGEKLELTQTHREEILVANDELASQGYRVLGIATTQGGSELKQLDNNFLEQDLTFLGLVAMIDPPRPEVPNAIALCRRAGIQVTMVTGDYGLTGAAIAQRIGLVNGKARIITGEQLGHLSDAQLRQILRKDKTGLVFARVMPEQKLRLVEAYKTLGHVVAVTGDGVNDAPALRAANIGIAMGSSGTDIAREAADIILIDDNFATIVSAIEEGRAVYQNIRKFMTYILASNMAEFLPFLAMVFLKLPPILVILQILAIDLGTDMLPALALGAEKPEVGSMELPPRRKSQPLLNSSLLIRAYCFLGLLEGLLGIAGFLLVWWTWGYNITELQAVRLSIVSHSANAAIMSIYNQATTMTLAVIVACQDGNVFACRSEQVSISRLGIFNNRLIWIGITVEWLLVLLIIYSPTLQKIFSTAPLKLSYWMVLPICPLLIMIADELQKRTIIQIRRMKARDGGV
jgi:Ca2+-transporting ATPase